MLKIANLSKTYTMPTHKVPALKEINLTFPDRGLVAIVGPSGSGKTTLMNIIGALDSDFDGDVVIQGKSLKAARGPDLDTHRRNTVGFIFQHFALIPSLTGLQNVELAMELSHNPDKTSRALALLEQVGLAGHYNKQVNRLSGGQKQRVAIARALANDPSLILADEPTGALDSKTGLQVMELLKELAKSKLVLVITHSPELAAKFADTVVEMADGQVAASNPPAPQDPSPVIGNNNNKTSHMSFVSAIRYAARSLWLKKGRTMATALGTSIGIVGIALAIALTSGASATFQAQVTEIFPINNITVSRAIQERPVPGLGPPPPLTYPEIQTILGLSDKFSGYHASPTEMLMPREVSLSLEDAVSQEFEDDSLRMVDVSRPAEIIEEALFLGRLPMPGIYREAVLPLNTANALLPEGAELSALIGQPFYVRYVTLEPAVGNGHQQTGFLVVEFTIVGITSTNALTNSLFLNSGTNMYIFETYLGIPRNELNFSALTVYAGPQVRDVRSFIQDLNEAQGLYTFASTLDSTLEGVKAALAAIRNVLVGLSSISVLVALLMISIVIYISVLEKTRDIGIIRAIGGRMADIRNIFLAESMLIGLLSGTIGVTLAYLFSRIINHLASQMVGGGVARMMPTGLRIARLSPEAALGLIAFCIFLSVLSGLIPARKAAALDPVKALRAK